MRRKSTRNSSKVSPDKVKEAPKKTRRASRRHKQSTSESDSDDDTPLARTILEPQSEDSKGPTDEDENTRDWKVIQSGQSQTSEVTKIKIRLAHPCPGTPERTSKRLRNKSVTLADDDEEREKEKSSRRTRRRGGSPKQEDLDDEVDVEEKRAKGKSKGKNKSKLEQTSQVSETEIPSEISENAQVTAQSPHIDNNDDADNVDRGLNQMDDDSNPDNADKIKRDKNAQAVNQSGRSPETARESPSLYNKGDCDDESTEDSGMLIIQAASSDDSTPTESSVIDKAKEESSSVTTEKVTVTEATSKPVPVVATDTSDVNAPAEKSDMDESASSPNIKAAVEDVENSNVTKTEIETDTVDFCKGNIDKYESPNQPITPKESDIPNPEENAPMDVQEISPKEPDVKPVQPDHDTIETEKGVLPTIHDDKKLNSKNNIPIPGIVVNEMEEMVVEWTEILNVSSKMQSIQEEIGNDMDIKKIEVKTEIEPLPKPPVDLLMDRTNTEVKSIVHFEMEQTPQEVTKSTVDDQEIVQSTQEATMLTIEEVNKSTVDNSAEVRLVQDVPRTDTEATIREAENPILIDPPMESNKTASENVESIDAANEATVEIPAVKKSTVDDFAKEQSKHEMKSIDPEKEPSIKQRSRAARKSRFDVPAMEQSTVDDTAKEQSKQESIRSSVVEPEMEHSIKRRTIILNKSRFDVPAKGQSTDDDAAKEQSMQEPIRSSAVDPEPEHPIKQRSIVLNKSRFDVPVMEQLKVGDTAKEQSMQDPIRSLVVDPKIEHSIKQRSVVLNKSRIEAPAMEQSTIDDVKKQSMQEPIRSSMVQPEMEHPIKQRSRILIKSRFDVPAIEESRIDDPTMEKSIEEPIKSSVVERETEHSVKPRSRVSNKSRFDVPAIEQSTVDDSAKEQSLQEPIRSPVVDLELENSIKQRARASNKSRFDDPSMEQLTVDDSAIEQSLHEPIRSSAVGRELEHSIKLRSRASNKTRFDDPAPVDDPAKEQSIKEPIRSSAVDPDMEHSIKRARASNKSRFDDPVMEQPTVDDPAKEQSMKESTTSSAVDADMEHLIKHSRASNKSRFDVPAMEGPLSSSAIPKLEHSAKMGEMQESIPEGIKSSIDEPIQEIKLILNVEQPNHKESVEKSIVCEDEKMDVDVGVDFTKSDSLVEESRNLEESHPKKEEKRRHKIKLNKESKLPEETPHESTSIKRKERPIQERRKIVIKIKRRHSQTPTEESGEETRRTMRWENDGLKSIANIIEVTSDFFLDMYPDLSLLEEHDVKLERREYHLISSEHERKREERLSESHEVVEEERINETNVDNIIAMNRKISIVDDDASKLKPPPSPAKNERSNVLYITNLVRPFTIKQLKELLERTGNIKEDGFWTDRIKSKCYVQYQTAEEAEMTRNALHGVHWPICNGKKLIIDYSTTESLDQAKNPPPAVPATPALPEKENQEPQHVLVKKTHKESEVEVEKDPKLKANNSWEMDSVKEETVHLRRSRSKDRIDKRRFSRSRNSRSPSEDYIKRKQKKAEEVVPQRAMDDLFRKTEATPCIYWQPLSPEEIALKQQQRLERMAEHKRRMETQARPKRGPEHPRGGGGPYRRRY